jgi:hypothetical protein
MRPTGQPPGSGIGLAGRVTAVAGMPGGFLPSGRGLIGRQAGQRLARHELAEMSTWQRILAWLARLVSSAGTAVPGGWFGLIALAILAVLAVTAVIYWVRPAMSRRARAESVLGGEPMTARDYRRAAERQAAAGDYANAIVETVRAIAADFDERGILPPRPGRTAAELGAEAGRELPSLAADLRTAARLFDDIRYGDKEGSPAGYQLVNRVAENARTARPAAAAPEPALAGFGVPR